MDTSLLAACLIFIPLVASGFEILQALSVSLPILLMSMACFILNDLHDIEKDQINHPDRPLPRGQITPATATISYFTILAASLCSIFLFVEPSDYYIYLLSIIVLTNYNHILTDFPYLKNFYVAGASMLPVVLVRSNLGTLTLFDWVAVSIFLFVFGREMLMDILDLQADDKTLVRIMGSRRSSLMGFGCQLLALIALGVLARNNFLSGVVIFLAVTMCAGIMLWQSPSKRRFVILGMKVQALAGMAFLVY